MLLDNCEEEKCAQPSNPLCVCQGQIYFKGLRFFMVSIHEYCSVSEVKYINNMSNETYLV